MTTTSRIQVSAGVASAHSYLLATFVDGESGAAMTVTGTYIDGLKKEGQGWKFLRRAIRVHFVTSNTEVVEQLEPMGFDPEAGPEGNN